MLKKLLQIFLLSFLLFSCNKKKIEPNNNNDDLVKTTGSDYVVRPIDSLSLKKMSDSIALYYFKLKNYEIWYDDENRNDLLNEIKYCYKDGLNPDDYSFEEIIALENKRNTMKDDEIIDYDILLTKTFKKIATHLYKGKLDPKKLYSDWDLSKPEIALSPILEEAIKEKTVASAFKKLKPQHYTYKQIKKSLLLLDKYPDYNFKKIEIDKKIEINDTVDVIVPIKKRLAYWKDYSSNDSIVTPIYDTLTFKAIKRFQSRHGLKPDGVIGQGTVKALNFTKKERIEQIYANLERWKWFPADFGNEYLLANLPDFDLVYVKENDTIATHRIVIGTPKRKTPILSSKMSNFVFNPTWTVPPTIIKEDLTPSAKRNIEYFSRTRITIYDKSGQVVEPNSWNPENSKSYRYVQAPSYNNSLGLVKLNFPNRHAVYLHDTNHRDYFVREYRALSSGCVRVENPLSLTEKILKNEGEKWNKAEIDSIIKKKNTKIVSVKNNINVYLLYWTNWLSKDNKLQFRNDVYNLDKDLYAALRN